MPLAPPGTPQAAPSHFKIHPGSLTCGTTAQLPCGIIEYASLIGFGAHSLSQHTIDAFAGQFRHRSPAPHKTGGAIAHRGLCIGLIIDKPHSSQPFDDIINHIGQIALAQKSFPQSP